MTFLSLFPLHFLALRIFFFASSYHFGLFRLSILFLFCLLTEARIFNYAISRDSIWFKPSRHCLREELFLRAIRKLFRIFFQLQLPFLLLFWFCDFSWFSLLEYKKPSNRIFLFFFLFISSHDTTVEPSVSSSSAENRVTWTAKLNTFELAEREENFERNVEGTTALFLVDSVKILLGWEACGDGRILQHRIFELCSYMSAYFSRARLPFFSFSPLRYVFASRLDSTRCVSVRWGWQGLYMSYGLCVCDRLSLTRPKHDDEKKTKINSRKAVNFSISD